MTDNPMERNGFTNAYLKKIITVERKSIIRAASLSILLVVFCACSKSVRILPLAPDRLDVLEQAFHLYFREETGKDEAIRLLKDACYGSDPERYVFCYDLGYILGREGRSAEAWQAYSESYQNRKTGLALSGMLDTGKGPDIVPNRIALVKGIETLCRDLKPKEAMDQLVSSIEKDQLRESAPANVDNLPTRETISQPFFSQCLASDPRYGAAVAKLPSVQISPGKIFAIRAERDSFNKIWDMQRTLESEANAFSGTHPVTVAWKAFIDSVRRRDVISAERNLANFYRALDSRRTPDGAQDRPILAMKRASGALIASDPFFYAVKTPGIQKLVRDCLPGSGLFESR